MSTSFVIDFYDGTGTDHRGRTIHDMLVYFKDEHLEKTHDYIQWLFPLDMPSAHMPYAPILTKDDIEQFKRSPDLQARMVDSLEMMLAFYGLEFWDDNDEIIVARADAETFAEARKVWLTPNNHNFLRLTRMINSLAILGLDQHARALCRCLWTIAQEYPDVVTDATVRYWTCAAGWL